MSIEDRWVSTAACKWPHKNGCYILSLADGTVVPAEFERITYPGDNYLKPRWFELDVPSDNDFLLDDIYIPEDEVVAWMPLPQAYKKGAN